MPLRRSIKLGAGGGAELVLVMVATAIAIRGVAPAQWLTNALPFGGDHAGHAVVPWITRHQLLPFHFSGWSDAWFNGFPVNQLYPAVPNVLIALLSYLLPLAIATKLVTVSGIVVMPLIAWAAARWADLPRPYPALLAIFTLPSLFDTSCVSCGGNVASVLGGEYSYQLGLAVGLLALGAVDRLLRTGERRASTAVIVAIALLCHPVTAIWVLLGCLVLAAARHPWTRGRAVVLGWLASSGVAVLLAATWWLPFLARRGWMTSPDFAKRTQFVFWLLPGSVAGNVIITLVALAGIGLAAWRRHVWLLMLAGLSAASVLAFLLLPHGQFFNLRVLPFYQLGRWLLVGAALAELTRWLASGGLLRRVPGLRFPWATAVPAAAAVVVVVWNAITYGWLPGVLTRSPTMGSNGAADVLGFHVGVTRLAAWPHGVLAGYENRPDYPQLQGVIAMLQQQAKAHGCGRLEWAHDYGGYDPANSPFGDDDVFWRAPLWTNGCLTTESGSLLDSSATTPAIELADSAVSTLSEQWKSGLPYQRFTIGSGSAQMGILGVRYYLTNGGAPAAAAASDGVLTKLASSGTWTLWQLGDSSIVRALEDLPIVAPGVSTRQWQQLEAGYAEQVTAPDVPLVASGPPEWPRISGGLPAPVPVTPASVSNVQVRRDRVSFHVDRTGTPILVKVSDYPGWGVSGATGPYRATPNFLVVVPTGKDVVISRHATAPGVLGFISGVLGLLGLVLIAVTERWPTLLRRFERAQATAAYRPKPQGASRRAR